MRSAAQHILQRLDVAARATVAASAVAGTLTLVVLLVPLLFGERYCGLDLTRVDLGLVCELKLLLTAGASLEIAPHLSGGSPLLARPTAQLLYPLRWLVLPLPPDLAVSLQAVLHLALGAAAASWLARSFRARPAAAVSAGLLFAFSGTALNLMFHSVYLVAVAWLPLVWAAARRARRSRGGRTALSLLGIGLCLLLLGGEPQTFVLAFALVLLELALAARRSRRAQRWWLARVAAVALAAAAAGSLPWIAFWAEAVLTPRAEVQPLVEALDWSFDPSLWPALLWPHFITDGSVTSNFWALVAGSGFSITRWNPSPYLGAALFVAVICGAPLRRVRVASLVTLVSLLFALGAFTPVLPLLIKLLPPLALFRYPQKYLLLFSLAAVVVGVCFLDQLARDDRLARRLVIASGLVVIAHAGAYGFFLVRGAEIDALRVWLTSPALADLPPLDQLARRAVVAATVPLVAGLLVCVLLPRRRLFCLGIVLIDVVSSGVAGLPRGAPLADLRGPLDRYAAPARVAAAAPAVLCVHNNVQRAGVHVPGGTREWNEMAFYRLYLVNELQACAGVVSPVTYSPLQTSLNVLLADRFNSYLSAPARALGCTHLVMDHPPRDGGVRAVSFADYPEAVGAFMRAGPQVFELLDPVPTAFVARRARLLADDDAILARLLESGSAAQTLAVVDDPMERLPALATLPAGDGVRGVAADWRDTDDVTLRAVGHGAALLGLRVPFQVGWRAEQSERPLPLVRAGGQHLAALVADVGAGPVRFRYRAPHLGVGIAVMSAGLVAFGLLVSLVGRRR